MNLFVTSLLMTFINILIVAIWKLRHAFRAHGWGHMPLQAVKLPISHNNVVGENTVLQLNILETDVLTLVVQNSSPTRLRLVGDELWTTRVRTPLFSHSWFRIHLQPDFRLVGDELWTTRLRTPVSKMLRWRTYKTVLKPKWQCHIFHR